MFSSVFVSTLCLSNFRINLQAFRPDVTRITQVLLASNVRAVYVFVAVYIVKLKTYRFIVSSNFQYAKLYSWKKIQSRVYSYK